MVEEIIKLENLDLCKRIGNRFGQDASIPQHFKNSRIIDISDWSRQAPISLIVDISIIFIPQLSNIGGTRIEVKVTLFDADIGSELAVKSMGVGPSSGIGTDFLLIFNNPKDFGDATKINILVDFVSSANAQWFHDVCWNSYELNYLSLGFIPVLVPKISLSAAQIFVFEQGIFDKGVFAYSIVLDGTELDFEAMVRIEGKLFDESLGVEIPFSNAVLVLPGEILTVEDLIENANISVMQNPKAIFEIFVNDVLRKTFDQTIKISHGDPTKPGPKEGMSLDTKVGIVLTVVAVGIGAALGLKLASKPKK